MRFTSIRDDLAHLYFMSYYPQPNPNRGWRAISVKLSNPKFKKYRIRTRSGYRPTFPARAPVWMPYHRRSSQRLSYRLFLTIVHPGIRIRAEIFELCLLSFRPVVIFKTCIYAGFDSFHRRWASGVGCNPPRER